MASKWGVRGLTRRATATTVLCGEHFRRRQANAIGGTRAQDLLVVYSTTIQGYGHMLPNAAVVAIIVTPDTRSRSDATYVLWGVIQCH